MGMKSTMTTNNIQLQRIAPPAAAVVVARSALIRDIQVYLMEGGFQCHSFTFLPKIVKVLQV